MKTAPVEVAGVKIGGGAFGVIAGLCVIENEAMTLRVASELAEAARRLRAPFVFKASYDKANRTSVKSYRGPGLEKGLAILEKIKKRLGVPLLVDVHREEDVAAVASVADIVQIPAFLSRQTDLLLAAARSRRAVNVKKGQFLSPAEMKNVVEKIESAGCRKILLTERGSSFGYNNLVVDMRSVPIMKKFGYPVVFDATHSVQLPGAAGDKTGGLREFALPLSLAAAAAGADAVFAEVHPDPARAPSDGANSLKLSDFAHFLEKIMRIAAAR